MVLFLGAVNAPSQPLPYLLTPNLTWEPPALYDLPDSTCVQMGTTFAPLYSEKDRATNGDIQHVELLTQGFSAGFFSRYKKLKYYVSLQSDQVKATYKERASDYYFVHERSDRNVAAGAAYLYKNLYAGCGIGRHLPANMDREHVREIIDDPGLYLTQGPWQFSCAIKAALAPAALRLSLFSGPVQSSATTLVNSNGSNFRTFPLSIIRHSAEAGVELQGNILYTSTLLGADYFEDADLLTVKNSMPQDVALVNYHIVHKGTARLNFTDSLGWRASGSVAGGWGASYNFDRDRFTFFEAEAVRFNSVAAEVGARLPGFVTAGGSHYMLEGSSPKGHLKLSALSAWSLFESLDYRYRDALLTYAETGLYVNRRFRGLKFECTPQINVAYVKTEMTLNRSRKEIVVLLPVYGNETALEVFATPLLLVTPSVSFQARWGSVSINGSLHQILPVVSLQTNASKSEEGIAPNPSQDNSITGGTVLSLHAVWNLSEFPH